MTKIITATLAVTFMLLVNQFSFAGATEDLWVALKSANYPGALTAIAAGADVKSLDASFGTPLNLASCWASADVVKALIDAKSEINFIAPANGYSPLMNAANWGNLEAVKLLLDAGADIKIKNKLGGTMLAAAVAGIKLDIIKMLVNAGADPLEKYTLVSIKDYTLLNALAAGKEPEERIIYFNGLVEPLSKLGVTLPPSILNAKVEDFSSLESIAVFLLEKGLDPNQKVPGWDNILMQSLDMGKTGVAKALIEHGVKADFDEKKGFKVKDKRGDASKLPNITYSNGDFVIAAVLTNNLEFVKLMVEKYPKYVKKEYEGNGYIRCNAGFGASAALTNYKAEGVNLLMVAAERGNIEIVKYLISKGAGRGEAVEIKQFKSSGQSFCPMFSVMFTMGFARHSNNEEVIEAVKAAGFGKE